MAKALILKITLEHRKPSTWRQLAVPADTTYDQLHQWLQTIFDWDDMHLHAFYPAWNRGLAYENLEADPYADGEDERGQEILPDLRQGTVQYVYDFGESWEHRIKLEQQLTVTYALPRCLAGRGAGFYEDGLGARDDDFDLDVVNDDLANVLPDSEMMAATQSKLDELISSNFDAELALFEKSPERAQIKEIPTPTIKMYVQSFALMMADVPVKQWTKAKLEQGFDEMATQIDDQDALGVFLVVISDFLMVMLQQHQLPQNFTYDDLGDLLTQVTLENGLMDDDDFSDEDITDEEVMQAVDSEYGGWMQKFFQSKQWQKITMLTGDAANDLIMSFIANMYSQGNGLIPDWQPADLTDMMLHYYPYAMVLTGFEAQKLPGLVTAFVDFLHDNKQVTAKQTKRIIKTIQNNGEQMHDLVVDPDNWGEGKTFAMKMQADGVDITDHAAIDRYLQANGLIGVPEVPVTVLNHVKQFDGRNWRQATATRVHNDAAELVWNDTGDQYAQRIVVQFVDEMYAQYLVTPQKWTVEMVAAQWVRHLGGVAADERAGHIEALRNYCELLGEHTSMSKKQARALAAVFESGAGQSAKIVPFKRPK